MTTTAQEAPPIAQIFAQALALHQSGAISEAQRLYRAILAHDPHHFDSLHLLGVTQYQLGKPADSVALISQALTVNSTNCAAHSNLGNALRLAGRAEESLACYDAALRFDPNYPEAHYNRGVALSELTRFDDAAICYHRAIALKPDFVQAHYNLGNAMTALQRHAEALASFDAALAIQPTFADALNNRGNTLKDLGRPNEALESYAQALALKPSLVEAYYNTGTTLNDLLRYEEAVTAFEKALALKPDYVGALFNGGNALRELHRLEDAIAWYDRAIAINPDYAEAFNNRGNVLKDLDRYEEALSSYEAACRLRPTYAEAVYNRGNALKELKRLPEAVASYDLALTLRPNDGDFLNNKGMALLQAGSLLEGAVCYEARTRTSTPSVRTISSPQPIWDGIQDLRGKRLLVYWEQGFGDTIQFCRYLPCFGETGAQVLFAPQKHLRGLMEGLVGHQQIVDEFDPSLSYDVKISLISSMFAFRTTLETVPATTPYLYADAKRVAKWRQSLAGPNGTFTIGICWQGSQNKVDRGRSVPLRCFEGIGRIPGVRLVSLHKGAGEAQLDDLPDGMSVTTLGPEFDSGPDAFVDTAAVMECCDLIISSDTATAHLAGALGRPVWVPLKHVPDWRWMLDRPDTPWYPTARLYRQHTAGDWSGVFGDLERDVTQMIHATQGNWLTERFELALSLQRAGDVVGAETLYRDILDRAPNHPDSLHLLGVARQQQGDPITAVNLISQAISLSPAQTILLSNLGNALKDLGQFDKAIAAYDQAIQLNPEFADAWYNRGLVLARQGKSAQAIASYDRAITLNPDHGEAYNNRGNLFREIDRLPEALSDYEAACRLRPENGDFAYNRATVLKDLHRLDAALQVYDHALTLKPNDGDILTSKGMGLMMAGSIQDGAACYEARIRATTLTVRKSPSSLPDWDGTQDLRGKRLLVYWEQGFGDTIQFCRYLPQYTATGAQVLFAPHKQLRALMSGLNGNHRIVDDSDPALTYDVKISLLSSMHVFGTALETVPAATPYLQADAQRIAHWRQRLAEPTPRFTIGICWQGSKSKVDHGRSVPLRCFEGIARLAGVRLVSLHKGAGEAQLNDLPNGMSVTTLGPEFDSGPDAFLDTAAVMTCCDLIISSDTATAHLAGALGRAVWIPLKHVPDWRWMLDRPDSPWYPTARLYRQKSDGDWFGVFRDLERDVVKAMNDAAPQPTGRSAPEVPVSWGELIDKITILRIKSVQLTAERALENVRKELQILTSKVQVQLAGNGVLDQLTARLMAVNEALWEIEDAIRDKEAAQEFDARFIELARSVYIHNDERARIKREINDLLGSDLVEEKGYAPYSKT